MLFKECPLSTYQNFCKKHNIKVDALLQKEHKVQTSKYPPDESLELDGPVIYDRKTKKYKYTILVENQKEVYRREITEFLMRELGPNIVTIYGIYTHLLIKENHIETLTGDTIEILKDALYYLTEQNLHQIMYLFILENIEQYKKFLVSEKLNKKGLQ